MAELLAATYPVEPEKEGADHGEEVRVVSGALVGTFDAATSQHFGDGEAKVGSKNVNVNGQAYVVCLYKTNS